MNPEDQFARLKHDDDRWENTSFAGATAAASVERRRLPLWGQLSIGIAAGLIVGLVVTLGVTNLRHDALPPAVSPSPTPTSAVPGAFLDDGYVMNRPFAEHFDFDATTPEPVASIGANGSAPWVVIDAVADASSLTIAYVANGDLGFCGKHQGVDVVESDTTVTITVVNDAVAAEVPCDDGLGLGYGTVALEEPLGERALFHGPLTHPWDSAMSPLLTVDPAAQVPEVGTTCSDLLSDATTSEFEDDGLTLRPDEGYGNNRDGYAGDILDAFAEAAGQGDWASAISVQYGGLACRWEAGETYLDFGFGPITAQQSDYQQARLEAAGWSADPDYAFPLLVQEGTPEYYAFGDGWWAYENNVSGTGLQVLDIIATSSHAEAFPGAEVAPTGTATPPVYPDAYITTAGYGDVKLGSPVAKDTDLLQWIATDEPGQCAGHDGYWASSAASGEPFKEVGISVGTANFNAKQYGAVESIVVYSPDISTKSGAHIGLPEADLKALFPKAEVIDRSNSRVYIVADNLGQVIFEVGDKTNDQEYYDGPAAEDVVVALYVFQPGREPAFVYGSGSGPCI